MWFSEHGDLPVFPHYLLHFIWWVILTAGCNRHHYISRISPSLLICYMVPCIAKARLHLLEIYFTSQIQTHFMNKVDWERRNGIQGSEKHQEVAESGAWGCVSRVGAGCSYGGHLTFLEGCWSWWECWTTILTFLRKLFLWPLYLFQAM